MCCPPERGPLGVSPVVRCRRGSARTVNRGFVPVNDWLTRGAVRRVEAVAAAAHGDEVDRVFGVGFDLRTEPPQVDVDRPRVAREPRPPDPRDQFLARVGPAGMRCKQRQQLQLPRPEPMREAVLPKLVGLEVEFNAGRDRDGVAWRGRCCRPGSRSRSERDAPGEPAKAAASSVRRSCWERVVKSDSSAESARKPRRRCEQTGGDRGAVRSAAGRALCARRGRVVRSTRRGRTVIRWRRAGGATSRHRGRDQPARLRTCPGWRRTARSAAASGDEGRHARQRWRRRLTGDWSSVNVGDRFVCDLRPAATLRVEVLVSHLAGNHVPAMFVTRSPMRSRSAKAAAGACSLEFVASARIPQQFLE